MKILLKVFVINVCLSFLIGHPVSLTAQVPAPGTLGIAPESGTIRPLPERTHRLPLAPASSDFNTRMQALIESANPARPIAFERNSPAWKRQIKEVNFDGVPMGEVINWLRTQFPEVNFVNASEVDDVPVKLNLRSVTLDDIFVALNITTKGELVANPLSETMVSFFYRPMFPAEHAQRKTSRAYSLARYLAGRSPEETEKALKDLEDALGISWKMLQQANPEDQNFQAPQLNLHAPTKMLIAVGDDEQLQVIERFISQLEGRQNPPMMLPGYPIVAPQAVQIPRPAQIPQRQLKLPSTSNPASAK